jgi:molecular chaperone GrpE (heat shock protein)
MDMLNDPEMKEIVDDFCNEALELFDQLEEALEDFEDNPSDTSKLELFGLIIERVI